MSIEVVIRFHGHPNVTGIHQKTLEVTRAERLGEKGTCIIGVSADKACRDLGKGLKRLIRRDGSRVLITISTPGHRYEIQAQGSSSLLLTDPRDIVIRRTGFVCGRTLSIRSSAAASDLPRSMIEELKSPNTVGIMTIQVVP